MHYGRAAQSRPFFLLFLFSTFLPVLALAGDAVATKSIVLRMEADAYAGPVSIHAFTNDWKGAYHGSDSAFIEARVETEFSLGNYSVAFSHRYSYHLGFSEDTARVYYLYKNGDAPAAGRPYFLYLRARHYEADSLRLARAFNWGGAQAWYGRIGLNLLQGRTLTEGWLQGSAFFRGSMIDTDTIDALNAAINYHYSSPGLHEDELDWYPSAPTGYGYSFDMELAGQFTPAWKWTLVLHDLMGSLYWEDAPATRYLLSCRCADGAYDASGQLQVDRRFRQSLPITGRTMLQYDGQAGRFFYLDAFYTPFMTLGSIGAGKRWDVWQASVGFEPQTQAIEVAVSGPYGGLRWQADHFDVTRAHRLGLTLYGQIYW